mgnify:CR=1 FL=1
MADTVENTTDAAQKTGSDEKPPKAKREFNKVALGILAATAVAITVSIYFTLQFIDKERERDRLNWQVRLGIVADFRAAAVNDWVEEQFGHMRELTQNASLQLYLAEASSGGPKGGGLGEYLREIRAWSGSYDLGPEEYQGMRSALEAAACGAAAFAGS